HIDLPLDRCVPAPTSGMFHAAGAALPGAFDRAILAPAPAGDWAIGAGASLAARQLVDAAGLHPLQAGLPPTAPAGAVTQLLSLDVDGDCLPDVVVLSAAAPPALWLRARDGTFTAPPTLLPALSPLSG